MSKSKELRDIGKLKKLAEEVGIDSNPLFQTTLNTYQLQLNVIEKIKTKLSEDELLVVKEYVKGRENQYASPLLRELPKHCDSANKTANLLWTMIQSASPTSESDSFEDLLRRRSQL